MLKTDGRWRGEAVEGKRLAIGTLSNCRVLRNWGEWGWVRHTCFNLEAVITSWPIL